VGEGVERVVRVDAEALRGDEDGAGRAEADVARAVAHGSGADGGRGVVARAGDDLHALRQAERARNFRLYGADDLVALEEPRHLRFRDAAHVQHLPRPAPVRHVEQEHPARVRIVAGVHAGELVDDIVLRQHDLRDAVEQLRLVLFHPQQLRRGEAGERDVRGQLRELFPANVLVEPIRLIRRAPVVPQDRGAEHVVIFIQRDQTVHLPADADAGDLRGVVPVQQRREPLRDGVPPVRGRLLRPAGVREGERILARDGVEDIPRLIHEQQLHRRGAEVYPDVVQANTSFLIKSAGSPPAGRWALIP